MMRTAPPPDNLPVGPLCQTENRSVSSPTSISLGEFRELVGEWGRDRSDLDLQHAQDTLRRYARLLIDVWCKGNRLDNHP